MRKQLTKLQRGKSTRSERRFAEMCKTLHVPFRTKVKFSNIEVDFLIGRYAIEIDGHDQDPQRNHKLAELGFVPLHIKNGAVRNQELLKQLINNLCPQQAQISSY